MSIERSPAHGATECGTNHTIQITDESMDKLKQLHSEMQLISGELEELIVILIGETEFSIEECEKRFQRIAAPLRSVSQRLLAYRQSLELAKIVVLPRLSLGDGT